MTGQGIGDNRLREVRSKTWGQARSLDRDCRGEQGQAGEEIGEGRWREDREKSYGGSERGPESRSEETGLVANIVLVLVTVAVFTLFVLNLFIMMQVVLRLVLIDFFVSPISWFSSQSLVRGEKTEASVSLPKILP